MKTQAQHKKEDVKNYIHKTSAKMLPSSVSKHCIYIPYYMS